jgi:protein FAM50
MSKGFQNKFRLATSTNTEKKNDSFERSGNDAPRNYGIMTAEEWKGGNGQQEKEMILMVRGKEEDFNTKKKKRKKKKVVVSFNLEDEEDDNLVHPAKKMKITKCNDKDLKTDFLPDAEKERKEEENRQKLRQEWIERQENMKNEILEITYSYWDGSGHRKKLQMQKKSTILEFLNAACNELRDKYRELRFLQGANLLYIKEDVILPHDLTFYELIVRKARGLTGPLFHFDVHEDIRLKGNAKIDKDESHPGKIVTQKWYQRNKHIHPYCRWIYYMRPT